MLSLLFVSLLCQLGQVKSWIYTNQTLKCCHYVVDFFVVAVVVVVNFTLMLLVCAVALTRPRPHFTDVQPTDTDYSTDGARGATSHRILNRKLFAIIDLFCALLIYFNAV